MYTNGLLVVSLLLASAAVYGSSQDGSFRALVGQTMTDAPSSILDARDTLYCSLLCTWPQCDSFVFNVTARRCSTYSGNHAPLTNKTGTTLYQMVDDSDAVKTPGDYLGDCQQNQCANGASCLKDATKQNGYQCVCRWPWKGVLCTELRLSSPLLVQNITDALANRQYDVYELNGITYLVVPTGSQTTSPGSARVYRFSNGAFTYERSFGVGTIGYSYAKAIWINSELYIVLSGFSKDTNPVTYNGIQSKIFKWNGTDFSDFQTLNPTIATSQSDFVESDDGNRYLSLVQLHNCSVFNQNAELYKWNGTQFKVMQSIPTANSQYGHLFKADGAVFFALAHYSLGMDRSLEIYKLTNGVWTLQQMPLESAGTLHAKTYRSYDKKDLYLAAAVLYHGDDRSRILNYRWNTKTQLFDLLQTIYPGGVQIGAYPFLINEQVFVVAASHRPLFNSTDPNNAVLSNNYVFYRLVGTKLVETTRLPCKTYCNSFLHFPVDDKNYILFGTYWNVPVNSTGNVVTSVYEW